MKQFLLLVLIVIDVHVWCISPLESRGGATDQMSQDNCPGSIAKRVGDRILEDREIFLVWDYGGALIFDGLQYSSDVFQLNFTTVTDQYLDDFKQQPWAYGFKLLHDIPIARGDAIGDTVSLFPIAYLNRILRQQNERPTQRDWEIVYKVSRRILGWKKRLHDGTVSRDSGWHGEPDVGASFVWADDQYMGLTLLARVAYVTRNRSLAEFVSKQSLLFVSHLRDKGDGLYYHGYNDASNHVSCCKWGRANGWAMLAHMEVLEMLNNDMNMNFEDVQSAFIQQSLALLKFQGHDGRFHQVINESSTFLETSSTAMILTSWARGVRRGWLSPYTFHTAIWRAWGGLCSTVKADGTVTGICDGTGIQRCLSQYEDRPCLYLLSGDGGLGSILLAAAEMEQYTSWSERKQGAVE